MANNFKLLLIIGGALIGAAFILFILSNGLSSWSETENDFGNITYGLWRWCNSTTDDTTCADISCPSEDFPSSFCNKILAARAFITLACILSGFCGTLSVIYCAISGERSARPLILTKKCLAVACLIMGIIAIAIGISATMTAQNGFKLRLGVAAILGIVGVGINLIGTVIILSVKP
ncbi:unnamed protein product [Adineta steineri]|uniref:Claudin n=1 Tax=Adineta steineri TaxID=433720 RepID=A0A814TB74_9BILA|nr:unnamed protein product [Adineta steineri]CAF1349848.1 unnamed protein product [Adineta steineri]